MNQNQIAAAQQLLNSPKKIVIIPHRNPDGDAIGSTLGLYHTLNQLQHECYVITPNDYPEFLKFVPGNDEIIIFEKQEKLAKQLVNEADIIFTLDFNDFGRVGSMEPMLRAIKTTYIMIDHHQQPSDYATVMYSDVSMSSTCEMVYHFINFMGYSHLLNKNIADCLYTGIMTDTGSFRFSSTTSTTHKVVSHLIDLGAENAKIHNEVYDNNSESRLALLGTALSNMTVLPAYKTAYITLSQEELESAEFKKGDTEGFVNYGLSLKGIRFAVIFIENLQEEYIKISFRSQGNFSVNQFARHHFNGGGHDNAAGGRSDLNMKETVAKFVALLPKYQTELHEV